jgi:hypothetical protein
MLGVWPIGWLFENLKSTLFIVGPAEVYGQAHVFLKIRAALMISYAVSNRL